jgi:hypothetical protein
MFNVTATVWTLVFLFVLAATAAGTTATVGKFSVPFFHDTSRLLVLVIAVARCVQTAPSLRQWSEISKLLYSSTSRSLRYPLCSEPRTPISVGRVAWFRARDTVLTDVDAQFVAQVQARVVYRLLFSKSIQITMFHCHACSVAGFTSHTALATARPEFKNRDLLDCAKCYFSFHVSRAPVYSLANRVAKSKGCVIKKPRLGFRSLCYEVVTSSDYHEIRTV